MSMIKLARYIEHLKAPQGHLERNIYFLTLNIQRTKDILETVYEDPNFVDFSRESRWAEEELRSKLQRQERNLALLKEKLVNSRKPKGPCKACKNFFASYNCTKYLGECDCPKCQGFCRCPEPKLPVSELIPPKEEKLKVPNKD